jgi:hypothetical protein
VDKSVFRYRRSVRGVWVLGLGSGDGLGHGRLRLRLMKVVGPMPRSKTFPASVSSHPLFCVRPLCANEVFHSRPFPSHLLLGLLHRPPWHSACSTKTSPVHAEPRCPGPSAGFRMPTLMCERKRFAMLNVEREVVYILS